MVIHLRYFSWVREKLQKDRESVELAGGAVVADLLAFLHGRGGDYELLAQNQSHLRYAVNYHLATATAPIKNGDEVAIFPPVTGG